jgi:hypothetical protein
MSRPWGVSLRYGLTAAIILAGCFFGFIGGIYAAEDPPGPVPLQEISSQQGNATALLDCRQLATLLQQQKDLISRETGQLKREIAVLREEISNPGIKEIFAGIGYIFGLAGVGLWVHNRKRKM